MLLSEFHSIDLGPEDDWFDPVLTSDTRLFVDPFLVFKEPEAPWSDAHAKIIKHFDMCFRLIAEGNCNPDSVPYKKALHLLTFPEPKETCLGFTADGVAGAGSGRGYAELIGSAMVDAIDRGKTHLKHFEELGIFNRGIGADRISDVTCNILKPELIQYTQEVAQRHGIETAPHAIWAASFDAQRKRWNPATVQVLTNPVHGGPLLLIPRRLLRDLPQINDRDWWNWHENEQLRQDVNYELLGHVDKKTIVEMAHRNPQSVEDYLDEMEEGDALPYDFAADRSGVARWYPATGEYTEANPLKLASPSTDKDFFLVVESVIDSFRHFVEECGGWKLLWNDDKTEKPEEAAQLLFRGIGEHHCRANGIVLDREVNFGRGPVDFKFSNGMQFRALLEVKKVHNGKFWNGLENQLPSYLCSDRCRDGWFVAIVYRDSPTCLKRVNSLPLRVAELNRATADYEFRHAVVDARSKLSASNI